MAAKMDKLNFRQDVRAQVNNTVGYHSRLCYGSNTGGNGVTSNITPRVTPKIS